VSTYGHQITEVLKVALGTVSGMAFSLLGLALSAIVMGALLSPGPAIAARLQNLANRVFAPKGGEYVMMAGATVRNVTKGVVGVAAMQAFAIWIVLALFGFNSAAILAFICFILSIVQLGPGLVFLPVLIHAWNTMSGGEAILLTILAVPLTIGDSFLRPIMISKGLDTPMMIIIIGVIGGVMAFGLIGIFIGPVLFAVFYELFKIWVAAGDTDVEATQEDA
ncbi:MAG: AI-2E family transporter, partial [Pseudomonadota bacterium]